MNVRIISIEVNPPDVEAFKKISKQHLGKGIQESGVVCFELVQEDTLPNHFMLIEAYDDVDSRERHYHTTNHRDWCERITRYLAAPTSSKNFHAVFPAEKAWH